MCKCYFAEIVSCFANKESFPDDHGRGFFCQQFYSGIV
ncbi:hypothetical protein FRAHR75_30027 [Frankia sp. Hr75.2]|nr:hypothetical protein FRAHR75_30027 [Frankia sp. Hr75.2]